MAPNLGGCRLRDMGSCRLQDLGGAEFGWQRDWAARGLKVLRQQDFGG